MRIAMTFVALLALSACGSKGASTDTMAAGKGSAASLFDRLGGQAAIDAVVKDFVEEQVAKDKRINAFFANTDIAHLEKMLDEQICSASGGGCTYTGKSMKEVHANMHVKDPHFSALVEDLVKSLDKFKVGEREKKELLEALGGMHDDIVER